MTGPTPPVWAVAVPSVPDIHNPPPASATWEGLSATAIDGLRTNLINALISLISQAPTLVLNLIRQMIAMIGQFEDIIFEIINAVLAWITEFPELITTVIETVLLWITELPDLAIVVIDAIIGIITDIPTLITAVIDAIMDWIASSPDLIISVINAFLSWITGSSDLISTVINTVITWLTEVPTLVTTVINAFLGWIVSLPTAATAIIAAITQWAIEIPAFVTDLIGAMLNWVRDVPLLLLNVIETIIAWLTDETGLVTIIIEAMLGWITGIPELINTVITTGLQWVTSIPEIATDVINALLQMVTEIPGLITAVIEAVLAWIIAVPEMATAIINGVIEWLTDVPGLLAILINGLLTLVTAAPTLITDLITTAIGWVASVPELAGSILGAIITLIQEAPGIAASLISAAVSLIAASPQLIASIVAAIGQAILGPISSVLPSLLGFVQSGPLSFAPISGIVNAVANLLTRPLFNAADSVAGGGIWNVNASTQKVQVIADGSVKELVGNTVTVKQGQQITVSVDVSWSSLTGSGSPIRLYVATNQSDVLIESIPYSASGTNTLDGTYTVPSGVSEAAMLLVVEATATGGMVEFSNPVSNMLPVPTVVQSAIGQSGIFDNLFDVFAGVTGSSGKTLPNVLTQGGAFFSAIADTASATFANLTTRMTELRQTMQVLANVTLTPITTLVQNVLSFADIPAYRTTQSGASTIAQMTTTWRELVEGVVALSGGSIVGGGASTVVVNAIESVIEKRQTSQILSGLVITPINSLVTSIRNWWNAQTWS